MAENREPARSKAVATKRGPAGAGYNQQAIVFATRETTFPGQDVIKTLMEQTAGDQLAPEHIENLCLAIEGTSHFLYLIWRALQQHNVSLLELELQAEVDRTYLKIKNAICQ